LTQLTCIRKTLEQEDPSSQFDLLKFYCDWALHSKLQGRTAQSVLAHFNEGHASLIDAQNKLPTEIQNISKFNDLINDVKIFLQTHSVTLPDYSSSDWSRFISLYASIIEDCPLIINANISADSQISKVTAKVEFAQEIQSGQKYYKVRWIITDATGNDGELFIMNSFDA
jgi:hypothetical protein